MASRGPVCHVAPPGHFPRESAPHIAGGAFFLFADGHVRFISDAIDLSTYSDLGSMSDGRPVSGF